jgi:integrase
MPVHKNGPKYRCSVSIGGERVYFPTHQASKKAAEQIEARYVLLRATRNHEQAMRELFPSSPEGLTIASYEAEFLADRKAYGGRDREQIRESTLRFYRGRLSQLKDSTLGAMQLSAIDGPAVAAYARERQSAGVYAVNRDIQVLKTLLKTAAKNKKISGVPPIEFVKGEKTRSYVVSIEDARRYVACADPLLSDVIRLMYESPLRPNEIARLRSADVDLAKRTGSVTYSKSAAGKRPFRFGPEVGRMLAARIAGKGPEEPVFTIPGVTIESKVQKLSHLHEKARAAAGLPKQFKLYGLRHALATALAEAGMDAFQLSTLFGWSDPNMARVYVHMAGQKVLAAAEKFQKKMPKLIAGAK